MGARANARANAVTGAMIRTLTAQVAHLKTQIDELAEITLKERDELVQLKAELEEVPQLKADLHRAKAGLRNTKAELRHTKAELEEVPQLKAELHHVKADYDELTQLKEELDHARSTEIPALKEHVVKLEAELNGFRMTPKHKDSKRMNDSKVTFDCGPQAYERAIKVLATNPQDFQHFHVHPSSEEDRVVVSFSMSYVGALEFTRGES